MKHRYKILRKTGIFGICYTAASMPYGHQALSYTIGLNSIYFWRKRMFNNRKPRDIKYIGANYLILDTLTGIKYKPGAFAIALCKSIVD